MKQFGKIFKFELKYYLKNKIFAGVTIFLVLAIAVVMCFPRISAAFDKGESIGTPTDLPVMLVKAEDPAQAEMVQESFAAAFTGYDVQNTDAEIGTIKDKITSGEVDCAFVLTGPTSYTYYVNNLSMYDVNAEEVSTLDGWIAPPTAMSRSTSSAKRPRMSMVEPPLS